MTGVFFLLALWLTLARAASSVDFPCRENRKPGALRRVHRISGFGRGPPQQAQLSAICNSGRMPGSTR